MGFLTRLIIKLVINGVLLYAATRYFSGFILEGGIEIFAVGALLLTLLNAFLRPILKFLGALLPFITFALLAVVFNGLIIYLADIYLTNLAISGLWALVLDAILIGMVNAIF